MSPRTRLLVLLGLLVTVAVCARLGIWQLSRLRERRAANAAAAASLDLPQLDLNRAGEAAATHRRVRASGQYDPEREVILRGQAYREQPGVTVVTPLRLAGREEAVLVVRGFVPAPDAVSAAVDSLQETGAVEVRGTTLPISSRNDSGAPLERAGRTTWRNIDSAMRDRFPYPILDVYVVQAPDSSLPRFPRRLVPPPLDDGPHLSYAIQWFAFATIAVVGGTALLGRRAPTSRTP